ncbi:MAG: DUF4276 family protein [Candidatus Cloacimonetes bacterium]|nr:DUF4276 family protein [Candidatus Cloacimonadota bacterium]
MVKKILFIEGTKDDTNGNLREGFHKLLEQKLKGNMPRIKMANGISEAIKTFIHNSTSKNLSEFSHLLIDLDDYESRKQNKIDEYRLNDYSDCVFFMIQEMEAWFLSQPNILDDFYGENISQKITAKDFKEFEKPAEYLKNLTGKNLKRRKYHKVKHGVELLKMLNASELETSSDEFRKLIEQLEDC